MAIYGALSSGYRKRTYVNIKRTQANINENLLTLYNVLCLYRHKNKICHQQGVKISLGFDKGNIVFFDDFINTLRGSFVTNKTINL